MSHAAVIALADQRSAGILSSARRAFTEKGFDGASMQDLARTTGMSVGNFYRYFPSKAAIVEALIAQDIAEMSQDFAAILTAPSPLDALRRTIRHRVCSDDCNGDGALWAEITAASLRKAEIGAIMAQMETQIVGHLTQVFALVSGLTLAEAQHRFAAQAALIVMVVKATAMQPHTASPDKTHLTELILRIIDRILDDIALASPKD